MRIKRYLICLLLIFPCSFLFAGDFGLILNQSAGFAGNGDESDFDYSGIIVPRFVSYWGKNNELYISAGFKADYQNEEWETMPELLRTELTLRFSSGEFKAGRIYYSDPLGYVAEGLFDGGRFSYDTAAGSFGLGAWYTGFLCKSRASIVMTPKERLDASVKFDYADFANTYFAPARLVAALDWEHSNLANLFMVNLAVIGQFDLGDDELNSQYFVGSVALPVGPFVFDLGGCLELIQDSGDSGQAYSADLGLAWAPGAASRLAFLARYSSGSSDSGDAFLPINSKSQGFILKPDHSAITVLSLDYAIRLHRTFSLALASSYYIRNDLETYASFGDDGNRLGNEFTGWLYWSPVSDMNFSLGGGMFLPSMGDVAPDAKGLWRVELGLIMSLY